MSRGLVCPAHIEGCLQHTTVNLVMVHRPGVGSLPGIWFDVGFYMQTRDTVDWLEISACTTLLSCCRCRVVMVVVVIILVAVWSVANH